MRQLLVSCMFAVAATATCANAAYVEPNPEKLNIDGKALVMQKSDRERLAKDIAGYVCRGERLTDEYLTQSTKLLGLALLLDPTSRDAVIANVRLRSGKMPDVQTPRKTAQQLAEVLRLEAKRRLEPISKSDAWLAGYLLLMAVELDPKNDNAAYDHEIYKRKNLAISWDPLLGKETEPLQGADARAPVKMDGGVAVDAAAGPKAFARKQSSIKGLFVQTLPTGLQTGMALDIIASIYAYRDPNVTHCRFARPVGEQMGTSWDEALKVVRLQYPNWQGGNEISISFSDKYSPKDGGSAGTAFSLLLLSLFDNVDLDAQFAVTGDITVDRKVRKVGGIPAKIRGATLDKCRYVIIPKANDRELRDAVILNSLRQLWEIQVFTAETLDDVLAVVRTDRDKKLTEAMELFAKVQAFLGRKDVAGLRDQDGVNAIKKVAALAPNHASAQYLLLAIAGQLDNKLSVAGSFEATTLEVAPLIPYLISPDVNRITAALPVSEDYLVAARTRLEKLSPNIDVRAKRLHDTTIAYVKAVSEYCKNKDQRHTSQRVMQRREDAITKAQGEFREELERVQVDRSIIEALMR